MQVERDGRSEGERYNDIKVLSPHRKRASEMIVGRLVGGVRVYCSKRTR